MSEHIEQNFRFEVEKYKSFIYQTGSHWHDLENLHNSCKRAIERQENLSDPHVPVDKVVINDIRLLKYLVNQTMDHLALGAHFYGPKL